MKKTRWGNVNEGEYSSIDGRTFLNDEPQTIIQLLKNYQLWFSNERCLILKKSNKALSSSAKIIKTETLTWEKWTKVPETKNRIIESQIEI